MVRKRKTDYEGLIRGRNFGSYADEVAFIKELIAQGRVSPIVNSGLNGKKPAMYKRFWLIEEIEETPGLMEELQYRLSPLIDTDFYLRHLDIYQKERDFVLKLSRFITERRNELKVQVSENERSYAIWGREKFLTGHCQESAAEGVRASELLRHCGIGMDFLNVYHTAEPMAVYARTKDVPQNVLILENLDPFYGMRRHLMSGADALFGVPVGTLIYGGGKRVNGIFQQFELLAEDYLKTSGNRFYYFGDLDYEGIRIYEGFARRMAPLMRIEPFVPAYQALLAGIMESDRVELPRMKEGQNRNIGTEFLDYFERETADQILEILEAGKYIPQERLSVLDYMA